MVNTKLYLERCQSLGLRQGKIARAIGIHRASLYRKVRNKETVTAEQVMNLSDVLQLSPEEAFEILLCRECLPTGDRKESDGR